MIGPVFYIGLHQPSDGHRFERACISINRLETRKKPIGCKVLLDSGAFTEISRHGKYRTSPAEYAAKIRRLVASGAVDVEIAVSQDWMCEAIVLKRTGLTIADHQRLTIERYDALVAENLPVALMPVLQGYAPEDYVRHIRAYGDRLKPGMWVGVGSVCKRNGKPEAILAVLHAIKSERPDLRLHGFGVKKTSLKHPGVRELLFSADSMAWSDHGRKNRGAGKSGNDWREAEKFRQDIQRLSGAVAKPWQLPLALPPG